MITTCIVHGYINFSNHSVMIVTTVGVPVYPTCNPRSITLIPFADFFLSTVFLVVKGPISRVTENAAMLRCMIYFRTNNSYKPKNPCMKFECQMFSCCMG